MLDVVRIGKPEIGQEQLVDGEIGPGAGGPGREPSAVRNPFNDDAIILSLTLGGAEPTEVEVSAVQGDDGLAGGLVEPVRQGAEGTNGHGTNLQIR